MNKNMVRYITIFLFAVMFVSACDIAATDTFESHDPGVKKGDYIEIKGGILISNDSYHALQYTDNDLLADTLAYGFEACTFGFERNDLAGAKIHFTFDLIKLGDNRLHVVSICWNTILAGCFMGPDIIKSAWTGKIYNSALTHELLHYLLLKNGYKTGDEYWTKEMHQCVDNINLTLKLLNL